MTSTPDPDALQRAHELRRDYVNASTALNNPELFFPDWPYYGSITELQEWENAAAATYYEHLRTHRPALGTDPEFASAYSVLDVLAAEERSLHELLTDTGDPEAHHHDRTGRDHRRDR